MHRIDKNKRNLASNKITWKMNLYTAAAIG
jgi:hypothetical protein